MDVSSDVNSIEREFQEIDQNGAWLRSYQDIRSKCLKFDYTSLEAKKTENKHFNRYRDVSPYDHTRVILKSTSPQLDTDYINANFVMMSEANRKYILTQGPLPNTTSHFWLMVWEQNCKAILMLNKILEKNQVKCHQYWPVGSKNGGADQMDFEDVNLEVKLISENDDPCYITRVLRLRDTLNDTSKEILHFHYTSWPDFGVPPNPAVFLRFLNKVRCSGALDKDVGPAVVHCSAGIGRSGTFCLVDTCLLLIEKLGADAVKIQEVLLDMRRQRMGLIQTPDQLRFSYLAIIEGMKTDWNNINDKDSLIEEEVNANHVQNGDKGEEEEGPPPLPPPRGESLKVTETPSEMALPPLPSEPPHSSSSSSEESTPPSSPGNGTAKSPDAVRKRKQEAANVIAEKIQDMKRKQQESEKWDNFKRSLFQPFNIKIGLLVVGGGLLCFLVSRMNGS